MDLLRYILYYFEPDTASSNHTCFFLEDIRPSDPKTLPFNGPWKKNREMYRVEWIGGSRIMNANPMRMKPTWSTTSWVKSRTFDQTKMLGVAQLDLHQLNIVKPYDIQTITKTKTPFNSLHVLLWSLSQSRTCHKLSLRQNHESAQHFCPAPWSFSAVWAVHLIFTSWLKQPLGTPSLSWVGWWKRHKFTFADSKHYCPTIPHCQFG